MPELGLVRHEMTRDRAIPGDGGPRLAADLAAAREVYQAVEWMLEGVGSRE